jgi:hypothetical protein
VRSYILSHVFSEEHLKHLDPCGESEEEYHEEQKAYRKALRSNSFDSEDNELPHYGEFHADGMAKALKKRASDKKLEKDELETTSTPDVDTLKQA